MNPDDPNGDLYAQKKQIEQQIAMLKGQLVQNSEKLLNPKPPSLNNVNGNNYFEQPMSTDQRMNSSRHYDGYNDNSLLDHSYMSDQ